MSPGLGLLLASALAAGPTTAPSRAAPEPAPVYAMLPIRDLGGSSGEAPRLQELLRASLAVRGAVFVPEEALERVLFAHRIRDTTSVSRRDARAIADETGAELLIAMVLLAYEPGAPPRISLGVRTVDLGDGERVQSALVTLDGDDFRGLLGLGAVEDVTVLEREVIARVLDHFEPNGRPLREAAGRKALRKARPSGSLGSFTEQGFEPGSVRRVVVMPLVNATTEPAAGLLFAEILGHEWFRLGGVQVVETSELRAALIRARVRAIRLMDRELYARVAADLGATHFVLGRLEAYSPDVYTRTGNFPAVEASIRVLEAGSGRIVAAAAVRRRGDDFQTLLGLGVVRDLLQLADRTARELVALILA